MFRIAKRISYSTLLFLLILRQTVFAQLNPAFNKISLDVSTQPQNVAFDYNSCFALGASTGMGSVGLHLTWTALETAPQVYNFSILDIANWYYPLHAMPIDLNIDPLETNHLEVPSDLSALSFNHPIFIQRFKTLLDSVKQHLPSSSSIASLIIGSEGDVYMGSNAAQWQAYTLFYDSVAAHAKLLWPGIKIATELTYDGLINYNSYAQSLNANSDYIGVSYYPLNSNFTVKPVSAVPTDFAALVNLYPSKPICFYQYGYPSSTSCNSSEFQQAQFITQTFSTWDNYAANIRLIDFTWLHDLDTAVVNYNANYYGIHDTCFKEFLRSLGLRTWNGNGTDKAAFIELQCQAKQRGFNNLSINCANSIGEFYESNEVLSISPNPSSEILRIHSTNKKEQCIQLLNLEGKVLKTFFIIGTTEICIADLVKGIYFLKQNKTNTVLKFSKE